MRKISHGFRDPLGFTSSTGVPALVLLLLEVVCVPVGKDVSEPPVVALDPVLEAVLVPLEAVLDPVSEVVLALPEVPLDPESEVVLAPPEVPLDPVLEVVLVLPEVPLDPVSDLGSLQKRMDNGGFPGLPVVKILCSQRRGPGVGSLVGELNPRCHN